MDRHLNIFEFFNNHDYEYYEDNMSRAFALCLKYDTVLLDNVLKQILDSKLYSSLFNTDYPDYSIKIDLQKRPTELTDFTKIIAITCSANEVDIDKIPIIDSRTTDTPETDLSIEINDTCLIFEFKRTGEDCSAQLKCQAEKVKANCSLDTSITYVDFNWKKIVKSLLNVLSLQKQINLENQYTLDFVKFIEKRHPEWFPKRLLTNISFPKDDADPCSYNINSRLNQIKTQIFGQEQTKEIAGRYYRLIISVDWGWANEVHVGSYKGEKENYITIEVYLGDTKAQGWYLYKPNKGAINWPAEIKGYELDSQPYMKFSHFNSGLFWYCPDDKEYQIIHNRDFFAKQAGRYQKNQWTDFENLMEMVAPKWRERCEYNSKIANSNRSYFDLSLGSLLTVYIPYKMAQELDDNEVNSKLAVELREIIMSLKDMIDKN
jgi:hypothetical protein